MALGTTELTARSTLWPPISTPLTSSTSSNSEASSTSTSRKRIGTPGGMWLSSRCSSSLLAYSSGSASFRRLWATMWISVPVGCLFDEPLGRLIYLYALLAQLERAVRSRDQRYED